MGKSKTLRVRIVGPDGSGREQELRQDRVLIGSGPLADLNLGGEGVSPLHALLLRSGSGQVRVVDLNSQAGTFVAERRLGEALLERGASLSIGAWRIAVDPEPAREHGPLDRPALEARLFWGGTLLESLRLEPGERIPFPRVNPSSSAALGVGSLSLDREGRLELPQAGVAARLVGPDGVARPAQQRVSIGAGERAEVTAGPIHCSIQRAQPQPPARSGVQLDGRFAAALGAATALGLAAAVAVLMTSPGEPEPFEPPPPPSRLAHYAAQPPPPPPPVHREQKPEGARAAGEEGKAGEREAKNGPRRTRRSAPPAPDARSRETRALSAGLLSVLGKPGGITARLGRGAGVGSALAGISGGGAVASAGGLGGLNGLGGLGARGTGPGGGGTVIGIGGLGLSGPGEGAQVRAAVQLKSRDAMQVVPGRTTVVGALSREEIERVIRRHEGEVRYCYELELQRDPDLHGKLSLTWTIGPAGLVMLADVAQTTLGSRGVESCLLERVRNWHFPEPRGGGQVVVTYPWVFKPAG